MGRPGHLLVHFPRIEDCSTKARDRHARRAPLVTRGGCLPQFGVCAHALARRLAAREAKRPNTRGCWVPGSSRRRSARVARTGRRRLGRAAKAATTGTPSSAGRAGSRGAKDRRGRQRRGAPPPTCPQARSPGGPGGRPMASRRCRSPASARRGRACPRSAPREAGARTPRSWLAPSPVDSLGACLLSPWSLLSKMKTSHPDPPFPRRSLRLGARQLRAGPPGCQGVSRGPGAQHVATSEGRQAAGNPFKQAASGLEGGGGGI